MQRIRSASRFMTSLVVRPKNRDHFLQGAKRNSLVSFNFEVIKYLLKNCSVIMKDNNNLGDVEKETCY